MPTKVSELKQLSGKAILIVEDDHFISRIYSKWLTAAGATVTVANDGSQGLRILDEQKVDLVLLDLGMPGLNGYDTLTQLRQKPTLQQLPVIVLSNSSLDEKGDGRQDLQNAGVKNVLRKYETSLSEIVDCISSYFPNNA